MGKRLEGIYPTIDAALVAIELLKEQGYNVGDIAVVANADLHGNFPDHIDAEITLNSRVERTIDNSQQSIWRKLKNPHIEGMYFRKFSTAYSPSSTFIDPLFAYSHETSKGGIVILVSEK